MPVIVVITKSYSVPERKENIEMVQAAFAAQKRYAKNLKKIIPVVASTFKLNDTAFAGPEEIMELIDATNDLMPEGLQAGTQDIANFKLSRKRYLCQGIIGVATTSGTVVGAVPISIADAVILKLQRLMRLLKSMELKMSSRRKNFLIPLLKWEQ